jgi:Ca-activated chloride channel family protein
MKGKGFLRFGLGLGVAAVLAVFAGNPGAAFAEETVPVRFEVQPDTPVVESGSGRRVIVRALVRSDGGVKSRRAPLAVALVLDKSGSMASDRKMENAKLGAMEALRMLLPSDAVTVVAYDDEARVLFPGREVGRGAEDTRLSRSIRRLQPGGSTALYDGVLTGAEELRSFVEEGFLPRILLLSDGIANVGPSSAEELARLGRKLAREEMTITTIGLGLDYNEDLMTALAAASGGNAYFARHAEMLPDIFARDMQDAVTVTARKVRFRLRCADGVRPLGILGREGTRDAVSMETVIDNLYATGEKYALFELELPRGEAGTVLDAATVELEYVDAATGASRRMTLPVKVTFTKDAKEVAANRDRNILAQAELAKNAEVREEAIRLVDEGRTGDAANLLKKRKGALSALLPSVGSAAPMMEKEAGFFEELAENILSMGSLSSYERKQVMNEAYVQKNQQAPLNLSDDVSGDVSPDLH